MASIHNLKRQIDYALGKIKASDLSQKNKDLLLKFTEEVYTQGLSESRVSFYARHLWLVMRDVTKDFDKLTKEDIKKIVSKIEKRDLSDYTKAIYKEVIKKLFQWIAGFEWKSKKFPEIVSWISTTVSSNNRKTPEEILSKEEIMKMICSAKRIRNKAIVSVLYESGCRIGEFLNVKLKHIEFDDYGCIIRVHGKTGSRRIRLVSCVPHLSNWLENHPLRRDRNAYLIISLGSRNYGERLSYFTLAKILKDLAKESKVKKRVNPHSFRHARATHLATKLTEAQMKEFFGWIQSSKMASVYVHLSGRDMDQAILKMYGVVKEKEEGEEIQTKICYSCAERNSFESKFCRRCGINLDPKFSITPKQIEGIIDKKIQEYFAKK